MRSRHLNPVNAVALLLVAGGIYAMAGRDESPAASPCDPAVDQGCAAPSAPGPASPSPGPQPLARAERSAETACRSAGYLCAGLRDGDRLRIERWKDFQGTLVVHIPTPDLADRGLAQRLQRAASSGVRLWNGQPFPIAVDERGTREAHFAVRWSVHLGGATIGQARTSWSPQSGLRVASLELTTTHPYSSTPMDPALIRLTAAHEMGHALGLPHSDNSQDVMYPTNTATTLSARDYRTLEALYDLEDGTEIVSGSRR